MAQKQIAPTTTMIRTPIRTDRHHLSLDLLLPGEQARGTGRTSRSSRASFVELRLQIPELPLAGSCHQSCTVSEEFADIRVGDLSARAHVWLVFHDRQLRRRIARQQPSVAITALVQKSFAHTNLIEIAPRGS
jgi:hypothetical protein